MLNLSLQNLSVSLWNDLADPVLDDEGLAGFKIRASVFYGPTLLTPFLFSAVFPFLCLHSVGVCTDRVSIALSLSCIADIIVIVIVIFINNIAIIVVQWLMHSLVM